MPKPLPRGRLQDALDRWDDPGAKEWHARHSIPRPETVRGCTVKASFTCKTCHRRWSSMKGLAELRFNRACKMVKMLLYGQKCLICNDSEFMWPWVKSNEILRVLDKLNPKKGVSRPLPTGKSGDAHVARGCEACKLGRCKKPDVSGEKFHDRGRV